MLLAVVSCEELDSVKRGEVVGGEGEVVGGGEEGLGLPHTKILLVPRKFFSLTGRLCSGGKRFD